MASQTFVLPSKFNEENEQPVSIKNAAQESNEEESEVLNYSGSNIKHTASIDEIVSSPTLCTPSNIINYLQEHPDLGLCRNADDLTPLHTLCKQPHVSHESITAYLSCCPEAGTLQESSITRKKTTAVHKSKRRRSTLTRSNAIKLKYNEKDISSGVYDDRTIIKGGTALHYLCRNKSIDAKR